MMLYIHEVYRCIGVSVCRCVGVSVCRCVGVSVCRCVGVSGQFHFSAIRRDIDLKCIQDTYMVELNSLKK